MPDQVNPKKYSIPLTEGPNRAAARSYLRGVGFSKEDLHKPIIGVANTWTEIGPCNFHLRDIATAVKQGIRDAGGTPMEFFFAGSSGVVKIFLPCGCRTRQAVGG